MFFKNKHKQKIENIKKFYFKEYRKLSTVKATLTIGEIEAICTKQAMINDFLTKLMEELWLNKK